jgi:ribonuclease HII
MAPDGPRSRPKFVIRRSSGLYGYERALQRAGFGLVAGADEAGRGACAGPLVAGAAILPARASREIAGLRDSKLMTPAQRERCYEQVVATAVSWSVVVLEAGECDRLGMHVANIQALRRALHRLSVPPEYVLTDGFGVDGLGVPGLAVWKGDRVAACVAAASVLAKVTRDRIMTRMHERWPEYDFATHKGYCTREHQDRLEEHGPCPEHRRRFDNVVRTIRTPERARAVG